jgi:hypothetical protein
MQKALDYTFPAIFAIIVAATFRLHISHPDRKSISRKLPRWCGAVPALLLVRYGFSQTRRDSHYRISALLCLQRRRRRGASFLPLLLMIFNRLES